MGGPTLDELRDALAHPRWPLYAGRRSCGLGLPPDPDIVEAPGPAEALELLWLALDPPPAAARVPQPSSLRPLSKRRASNCATTSIIQARRRLRWKSRSSTSRSTAAARRGSSAAFGPAGLASPRRQSPDKLGDPDVREVSSASHRKTRPGPRGRCTIAATGSFGRCSPRMGPRGTSSINQFPATRSAPWCALRGRRRWRRLVGDDARLRPSPQSRPSPRLPPGGGGISLEAGAGCPARQARRSGDRRAPRASRGAAGPGPRGAPSSTQRPFAGSPSKAPSRVLPSLAMALQSASTTRKFGGTNALAPADPFGSRASSTRDGCR